MKDKSVGMNEGSYEKKKRGPGMIRIIHADDEESRRYLIANKINRESDMQVIASVKSVNECLQELDRASYDIALIDLNFTFDLYPNGSVLRKYHFCSRIFH